MQNTIARIEEFQIEFWPLVGSGGVVRINIGKEKL